MKTTAETKRDQIFSLVNSGDIENMMQVILFAALESVLTDATESGGYTGTIVFVFKDDSKLVIDTDSYCYASEDQEIRQLPF